MLTKKLLISKFALFKLYAFNFANTISFKVKKLTVSQKLKVKNIA